MTKYVLNSGGLKNNTFGAKRFIAEMVKGLGDRPKILFCFFAEKRENWEEKFPEYVSGFRSWSPEGVVPDIELAFPDIFEEQIEKSDIVYIHGGDDDLVTYRLSQFDLPKILEGKVVGTNSAGTDVVVMSYWTCDWRQCRDGLGILPIKFIPHFNSSYGDNDPRGPIDWQKAKQELADYENKNLPIYALEEGEFEVFEV